MPVVLRPETAPAWRRRTTQGEWLTWGGWLLGVALTLLCFQYISDRTIWAFVWDAPTQ
jgi:phosphonate transport system permease protein